VFIASIVCASLALCGAGYYAACLIASLRFAGEPKLETKHSPPVTILKPVKGADAESEACFRSHFGLDYPAYQLLFGLADKADPAVPIIEKLRSEFPKIDSQLVFCPQQLGANRKVSSLAQMLPSAHHELLLVNDSDIRVEQDYLRRVIAPLTDSSIGMVTCLYRGIAGATLGSRLETWNRCAWLNHTISPVIGCRATA